MAQASAPWNVLPHRPIEKLDDTLWRVQGTLPRMALKRVMTVIRLPDGRLVVHSAVCLDETAMAELESWGRPAILLVPNAYHRLDAPAWVARYPELEVRCPRGSRRKVEQVVRVDGTYEDLDTGPTLTVETLEGVAAAEGVLTVRSSEGATLVFNDALFNMPHGRGVGGFIFRHITQSTGGPRVSRLFRMLALKDRGAFAEHLRRLAETPRLRRIIVSHHRMIEDDPAGVLQRVADDLG